MIKNFKYKKKFQNVKLIKSGCFALATISLIILPGCNSKKLENYYLVSKDGSYSICYRVGPFTNYDDYDYKSIIDDETVGSICSNGNNFDYELHHLSINFISELQVASLSEVLSLQTMDYSKLVSLASSQELKELGDGYFKNKHYYLNADFEYSTKRELKIFQTDDIVIIGYNVSPKRIYDTNRYIYSIIDSDTLVFPSDSNITSYSIDINSEDSSYITYDAALRVVENYKDQKVLKKIYY